MVRRASFRYRCFNKWFRLSYCLLHVFIMACHKKIMVQHFFTAAKLRIGFLAEDVIERRCLRWSHRWLSRRIKFILLVISASLFGYRSGWQQIIRSHGIVMKAYLSVFILSASPALQRHAGIPSAENDNHHFAPVLVRPRWCAHVKPDLDFAAHQIA